MTSAAHSLAAIHTLYFSTPPKNPRGTYHTAVRVEGGVHWCLLRHSPVLIGTIAPMAIPPSAPNPQRRCLSGKRWALWLGVGAPTILVVIGLSMVAYIQWQAAGYRRELAKQEQRVRDAGEPLDGAELNAWYQVPADKEDLSSLYFAAIDAVTILEKDFDWYTVSDVGDIPLPGEPWDDMQKSEELLARFDNVYALLAETVHRRGGVRYTLDFRDGIHAELVQQLRVKRIARLYCLRAAVQCRHGDFAQSTDSIIIALRAAGSLQLEPCANTQTAYAGLLMDVYDAMAYLVSDQQFPVEQIRRLRAEMKDIDWESATRLAMIGMRTIEGYWVGFQKLKDVDGSKGASPLLGDRVLRDVRPGDCAILLKLLSDGVDACKGTYPELWRRQLEFLDEEEHFFEDEKKRWPWDRNTVTSVMFPDCGPLFAVCAAGTAKHRCMLIVLAAEQQRREQGNYPSKLYELVPEYLTELPSDPFTGEPLRMRRDGERFTVYSVGTNEQDDGGEVGLMESRHREPGVAVPPYRPPSQTASELTPEPQ